MSKELWHVAHDTYFNSPGGTRESWQRVVDAISKELLREDEPVMWRIANICGDHFVFETACDEEEADAISSLLGEYWGGTDKLYLRPAPKVPTGMMLVKINPPEEVYITLGLDDMDETRLDCWQAALLAAAPKGETE